MTKDEYLAVMTAVERAADTCAAADTERADTASSAVERASAALAGIMADLRDSAVLAGMTEPAETLEGDAWDDYVRSLT